MNKAQNLQLENRQDFAMNLKTVSLCMWNEEVISTLVRGYARTQESATSTGGER